MANLNTISILIAAKDEASAVLKATADNLSESGNKVATLGSNLVSTDENLTKYVSLPIAAIGAASVKMAGDFQASMTRLVTSAGESQANLKLVSDGVLKVANDTGTSTTELAQALYTIESGGQHGANGLTVLKAAAEGAKAENSDLATVADAVTSVLVDYHLKANDAAEVTSKLVAATSAGKTTFEQLAAAMPAILPVASAAHVSLNDILGDLAAMTVHGMSAEQSAQNLADTIRHMQNPTAQQAKELALLGMTTTQLADDLKNKGLSGTLQEISQAITNFMPPGSDKVVLDLSTALQGLNPQVQALGAHLFDGSMTMKEYTQAAQALDPISAKQAQSFATLAGATHRIGDEQMSGAQVLQNYGQAMAKAMGDSTGLNVALMLTGENATNANSAIRTVAGAATEAGGNVKGWADIQQTFNFHFAQFKEAIQTTGISVGTVLLPPLTAMLSHLSSIASVFERLNPHFQQAIVYLGVAAVAAGPLLMVIGGIATGLAAISAPIAALIAGIALLSGVAIANFSHIEAGVRSTTAAVRQFWDGLKDSTVIVVLGQFIEQVFLPGLRAIWAAIVQNLGPALGQLWEAVTRVWQALNPALMDALKIVGAVMLGVFLAAVWAVITVINIAIQVFSMIVSAIANVIDWISNLIKWFGNLVGVVVNTIGTVISIFRNLIPAVADVVGVVGSLFGSLAGAILHAVSNFGSLLWDAGRNLVDGLANGIKSAIGDVTGAVENVGTSAVNKVKSILGIHSPSTVFHEIGQNITQGMVNGIAAGSGAVSNAMDNLTGQPSSTGGRISGAGAAGTTGASAPGSLPAGGVTNILSGTFNFQNADAVDQFFDRIDKTQRLARLGMAS